MSFLLSHSGLVFGIQLNGILNLSKNRRFLLILNCFLTQGHLMLYRLSLNSGSFCLLSIHLTLCSDFLNVATVTYFIPLSHSLV